MRATPSHAAAIWALGLTQIVGYGTLYYSFSILAQPIATEFDVPVAWIYGAISLALLAGGLISPFAGTLADRHGAGRVLALGSVAAAAALALCGLAGDTLSFLGGLVLVELASAFVLYATAFAYLAQTAGVAAQRSIAYLTLIAGFASTLFWPLTSLLLTTLDWHQVYFVFAALNLGLCLPLHLWLGRRGRLHRAAAVTAAEDTAPPAAGEAPPGVFVLMVLGFSLAGFVSAAALFHVVPLLSLVGLGSAGVLVGALFGPAQVLGRVLNMAFGRNLPAASLSVISALMMPLGLVVLALTVPSLPGAILFAVLFGFGTGLFSIVSGTLPLAIFGKHGYGRRLGWISLGRLALSALAPFAFAVGLTALGPAPAIWLLALAGLACLAVFIEIRRRTRLRVVGLRSPIPR